MAKAKGEISSQSIMPRKRVSCQEGEAKGPGRPTALSRVSGGSMTLHGGMPL